MNKKVAIGIISAVVIAAVILVVVVPFMQLRESCM